MRRTARTLINLAFTKEIIPIMKTIQLTLNDDLHRRAKTLAFSSGITFSELIRTAVEECVARAQFSSAEPSVKRPKGRPS